MSMLAARAAARRIDVRAVVITVAIAGAVWAWMITEAGLASLGDSIPPSRMLSRAMITLLAGFSLMFATFVADEYVDRGARRLPAYAWAVLAGTACAALAQVPVHAWLHLAQDGNGRPTGVLWQPVSVFLEYLLWASICVTVYVNRRTALHAARRMHAAQFARAHAQRRTLESRLQALQARIEPQFLSTTLRQVHDLHERDPQQGLRLLDDLIVYLRAALPQLRESSSTVARELSLAAAYLNVRQPQAQHVASSVPEHTLRAHMPPMVLLPLIDRLLSAQPAVSRVDAPIGVGVSWGSGSLQVEISGPAVQIVEADPILDDVRERLQVVYAGRAALRVESSRGKTRVFLEIPHDAADGDHR